MQRLSIILIAALPCCLHAPLHAASIYRCKDGEGHVSFNQHGCPADSQEELQRLKSLNLLGSQANQREIREEYLPIPNRERAEHSNEVVVVGEREAPCDQPITPQERRQAIIRKQVRAGMTRADVESALGKPERISSSNGRLRYHYQPQKGTRHQVDFDESGCVRSRR
ncbi:DUF4124 domain-containing protein [Pseudomonas sp. BN102]|uniref:DUF4124 domain-containing protein n=1 Tax=Pseudomonas sp. BN102 TaxID=2567886 RepID=UPI0024537532|nr:DUF4124 domain-containing protein [Pseudomonas sp. BN102]MDH4612705.1 DUF4124 domain-containing protein [Pseudomonas sp. BN102]